MMTRIETLQNEDRNCAESHFTSHGRIHTTYHMRESGFIFHLQNAKKEFQFFTVKIHLESFHSPFHIKPTSHAQSLVILTRPKHTIHAQKCTQMFILQSLEWHLNKSCYYSTNIQNSKPQGPTSITFSIESPTAISTPLLSVKIQAQATLSKMNQALALQLIM